MTRVAVTLTTINRPTLLSDFVDLQKRHGTGDVEVDYIVVGDLKTPSGTDEFVASLNGKTSSKFLYLDVEEQKRRFGHLTKLWDHIPVNSFARRNYGDLLAYQEGYDAIIRIDDDNFPIDGSFFVDHALVGKERSVKSVRSDNGWYNICEVLRERDGLQFYPRGFPFSIRWQPSRLETQDVSVRVAVNAGLWLGDPDVDAITRLCRPVEATEFDTARYGRTFALAKGTWSPINTQNTAFARATIPAAFVSPFAGRYDDILSGYVLRRIVDHMDEAVCYGSPLLNQIRNVHNYWKDLDLERIGGETILQTTQILRDVKLTGTNYADCFGEVIEGMRSAIDYRTEFYGPILAGMECWAGVFARSAV